MSRLRELLDRPVRDQPRLALAALAVVIALAIVAVVAPRLGRGDGQDGAATAPAGPPAPPVVKATGAPSTSSPSTPTAASADVARARSAARVFLRSYLPVLYGRAGADRIAGATAQLRRSLADARPVPPRIRERRPRLAGVDAQPQAPTSILMSATIDDGVVPPFRLIFSVERQPDGRWLVTNVAND